MGRSTATGLPGGLRFRTGLRQRDLPALADLLNRANEADRIEHVHTAETLANEVRHRSGWDPRRDVILAEFDGKLVAWTRTRVSRAETGEHMYSAQGTVDPERRRQGIGRQLLRRAEARLRERAAADPREGPLLLDVWAADTDPGARRLFESEGYRPVRFFFHMVRPTLDGLEAPVLPEGLEVRPARQADLDTIFSADEEAFRDHWMQEPPAPEHRARYLGDPRADPRLWEVAWAGEEVAGLVLPAVDAEAERRYGRRRVMLDSVAVRRPFRRHGLATALMLRALHAARGRGFTSADLWVDSENPTGALGIYQRLGFEVDLRTTVYHKPLAGNG